MFDIMSEATLVAAFGFAGGIVLGLAARLGRFCTMGAIEDVLYGDTDIRMRMWGMAIGVAMLGSFSLAGFGALDLSQTIYHATPWNPLASIFGGLLFGYGMALSGNCGFGALARAGGGDIRSFVMILVMGISAYITLSGPLALIRVVIFTPGSFEFETAGYAGLLAGASGISVASAGIIIAGLIIIAMLWSKDFRTSYKSIFWSTVVGLAIVSGWAGTQWVSNVGFDDLPVVSHTYSAPVGDTLLYIMTSSGGGLNFGIGSVFGVLAGAFIGSLIKGHFRWEACEDPRELRRQMMGAAFMGIGAIVALGCTIGQGISAFSVLAFGAPVTFAAIFLGAAFGLRQLITGFSTVE